MKKSVLFLQSILFLFIISCSSSDESDIFLIPTVPGENLKEGEIQIVFKPSSNLSTIEFEVGFDGKEDLKINWGDNQKLEEYSSGVITHEYKDIDTEYTITLQSANLSKLYMDDRASQHIKSLFLGKCPKLDKFSMYMKNNILENLDFSKCSQFQGDLYLDINKSNFDLAGLTNFTTLILTANVSMDMTFDNMSISGLGINFMENYFPSLKITNCEDLQSLDIRGFHSLKTERMAIGEFQINAPALNFFYIQEVKFNNDFNLNQSPLLKKAYFPGFDCLGKVEFNENIEEIHIANDIVSEKNRKRSEIEYFDFRNYSKLRGFVLSGLNNLKKVDYNKEDLIYALIKGSEFMDDYEYNDPDASLQQKLATKAAFQPATDHGYIRLSATN